MPCLYCFYTVFRLRKLIRNQSGNFGPISRIDSALVSMKSYQFHPLTCSRPALLLNVAALSSCAEALVNTLPLQGDSACFGGLCENCVSNE